MKSRKTGSHFVGPLPAALHNRYEAPLLKGIELEWNILRKFSEERPHRIGAFSR